MRKSSPALLFLACLTLFFSCMLLHAFQGSVNGGRTLQESSLLVRDLSLTDLCLFTEARYTRHPSQADLHAPFQDHPFSFEHFPSGSLVTPQRRSIR